MKQNKTQWTQINNSFAILAQTLAVFKVPEFFFVFLKKKAEEKLKYFSGTQRRQFLCVTTNTYKHTNSVSPESFSMMKILIPYMAEK